MQPQVGKGQQKNASYSGTIGFVVILKTVKLKWGGILLIVPVVFWAKSINVASRRGCVKPIQMSTFLFLHLTNKNVFKSLFLTVFLNFILLFFFF